MKIKSFVFALSVLSGCQASLPQTSSQIPQTQSDLQGASGAQTGPSTSPSNTARPETLLVGQESVKLAVGEQRKLDAAVQLSDGSFSKDITWLSSDTSVLLISPQGELKRMGSGDSSVFAIAVKNPQLRREILVLDPGAAPRPAEQTPIPVAAQPAGTQSSSPVPIPTRPPLDVSTIENTTIDGKVFDDSLAPVSEAQVSIKSLTSALSYSAETKTVGGTYSFNNVPAGAQIEIVVSKADFTTRRRVEVPKSNKDGDPSANRYDFGTDGTSTDTSAGNYALSEKPEVIRVSPAKGTTGVAQTAGLSLTFNKPVERKSLEESLTIRAFSNHKLSVDDGAATNTFFGPGDISLFTGSQIFNINDFNLSWSNSDTEVMLTFKDERFWPSDKESSRAPEYQVAFESFDGNRRDLRDKKGNSRAAGHFKFGQGPFENSFQFRVAPDTIAPGVSSISLESTERAGLNGDSIKVRFSEPMAIRLQDGRLLAGGMGDTSGGLKRAPASGLQNPQIVTEQATAGNYRVRVVSSQSRLVYDGSWGNLGGSALFDSNNDVNYRAVLLKLPQTIANALAAGSPLAGDRVTIEHVYADGSKESLVVTILSASYSDIQAALNNPVVLQSGAFTLTELDNPAGTANTADNKDRYSVSLSAQATGPNGKTIIMSRILPQDAFASDRLNAPSGGYLVFPNSGNDSRLNLFKPGDTVFLSAESGMQDPAGNNLSSDKTTAQALVP